MPQRTVLIEHHAANYHVGFTGDEWTVWELRTGAQDREVATFDASLHVSTDDLIQIATDAIDEIARALAPGTDVYLGDAEGRIVDVNCEALVEFPDDFGWYPMVCLRPK